MGDSGVTGIKKENAGAVLAEPQVRTQTPKMFKVMLLNDDFTPMDFVVDVLQQFFGKDISEATEIMLQVHRSGRGLCGVFPRELAETKVEQVCEHARQHDHPLQCAMEVA